ncbi:MAG TPA: hypothetical protein VF251_06510 [Pyrinomonadaceae bacterium]
MRLDEVAFLITSIFGKRALDQLSSDDYRKWAGEMLVQGYDSRSLRILAGLDRFVSTFEAEDYFRRSIQELDLNLPDRDTAIRAYGCEIAQQMVDGTIIPREGVRWLFQICIGTDYAKDFVIWYELDDALDNLLCGAHPFTYESATLDNFDEIAKREAANFISSVCPKISS